MVSIYSMLGLNAFRSKKQIDYEKNLKEKEKRVRQEEYNKEVDKAKKRYEVERLNKVRLEARKKAEWHALPTSEKAKRLFNNAGSKVKPVSHSISNWLNTPPTEKQKEALRKFQGVI